LGLSPSPFKIKKKNKDYKWPKEEHALVGH